MKSDQEIMCNTRLREKRKEKNLWLRKYRLPEFL